MVGVARSPLVRVHCCECRTTAENGLGLGQMVRTDALHGGHTLQRLLLRFWYVYFLHWPNQNGCRYCWLKPFWFVLAFLLTLCSCVRIDCECHVPNIHGSGDRGMSRFEPTCKKKIHGTRTRCCAWILGRVYSGSDSAVPAGSFEPHGLTRAGRPPGWKTCRNAKSATGQ